MKPALQLLPRTAKRTLWMAGKLPKPTRKPDPCDLLHAELVEKLAQAERTLEEFGGEVGGAEWVAVQVARNRLLVHEGRA